MHHMTGRYRDPSAPRTSHTLTRSGHLPWLFVYEAREVETQHRVAHFAMFTDDFGNCVPASAQTVTSLRGGEAAC